MVKRLFSGSSDVATAADSVAKSRAAIMAIDWGSTPAGEVGAWPEAIRSTVRTVLYAVGPMAVLIGREGIVVCNDAATAIFGDAWPKAQGRPIFEVLPIAAGFYREVIDAAFHGQSCRFSDQPINLMRNGQLETCWFHVGLSPIMGDGGEVFGTLLSASETSAHVRTRRALTRVQKRVDAALQAGGIVGTWDLDMASRKMVIDGALAQQYGISAERADQGVPVESLIVNLHPEDRERVLQGLDKAMENASDFQSKFRSITQDGALHLYTASGRPVFDEAGAITGLAGILIDTTSQSEAADALLASNMRFDTLVEAIPQIVWSADGTGSHDFFNHRWAEFTGIDLADAIGTFWLELVHPEDTSRVSEAWQTSLRTGQAYDIDYRFRHHSDGYRWLRVIALPMRNAAGEITRWYGTATDIEDAKLLETERALLNRELDHRQGNLFALLNGLISMSARDQPESAPFALALRNRLAALHRAHNLIRSNTEKKPVRLQQILEEVIAPYRQSGSDNVTIHGAEVVLKPETVTPFALIFHELATNSAKYGALSESDGQLTIQVTPGAQTALIHWHEQLGIAHDLGESTPAGFGSKLLSAIVEGQFRGRFERELTPTGIALTLRLPASLLPTVSMEIQG